MTQITRQLPTMSAMMRVVSIVDTATSVDMTEGCQYKSHVWKISRVNDILEYKSSQTLIEQKILSYLHSSFRNYIASPLAVSGTYECLTWCLSYHIPKHREELKIRRAAQYFWRNSKCLEMWLNAVLSVWVSKLTLRRKQRNKLIKIYSN